MPSPSDGNNGICNLAPDGGKDQSAICCLVMVARAVNKALSGEELLACEALSPKLPLIDFTSFGKATLQCAEISKMLAELATTLRADGFDVPGKRPTDEFIQLCESNMMLDTFWSLKSTKLWCRMWTCLTPAPGMRAEWAETGNNPHHAAIHALAVFDASINLSDTCIKDSVTRRVRVVSQDNRLFRPEFNHPSIIRILFKPVRDRSLGFKELQRFRMGPQSLYRLIAAVRIRAAQDEPDFVRLYDIYGKRVITRLPNGERPFYMPPEWDVGAYGHDYMLFFVRCGTIDCVEELPGDDSWAKRFRLDEDRAKLVEQDLIALGKSLIPDPEKIAAARRRQEEHSREARQPKKQPQPSTQSEQQAPQSAQPEQQAQQPEQQEQQKRLPPRRQRSESPPHPVPKKHQNSPEHDSSSEEETAGAKRSTGMLQTVLRARAAMGGASSSDE
ncbi:hypothetical protein ACHAQA_005677 [Verticillium albo-atrum]